mmetsp:Transcript_17444/g.40442  ORF Transcript_17444/g.40442 Transcript_17444/m.40442 type:complete len:197 (+) Transcript_17444:44-634(+)
MGSAIAACKGPCCHESAADKGNEERGAMPGVESSHGREAGRFATPMAVTTTIGDGVLEDAEVGGLPPPPPDANKAKSKASDKASASKPKARSQPSQDSGAPKLTLAPKEEPPPLKSALLTESGLDRTGAKLQVLLDNGWADCPDDDVVQVRNQLAGGSKKFAIQSRGAMYIIDCSDLKSISQENANTKRKRRLRVV